MTFQPNRIAVIGATGPTGIHLVRELARRGRRVRAVSRRQDRLEELFGGAEGVEITSADALDSEAVGRVVEGSNLVIDCIGLPPERMADHPKTARVISQAARAVGARCLQISSYWSFFPHRGEVVGEDHPREGGHEWFRLRREAERKRTAPTGGFRGVDSWRRTGSPRSPRSTWGAQSGCALSPARS